MQKLSLLEIIVIFMTIKTLIITDNSWLPLEKSFAMNTESTMIQVSIDDIIKKKIAWGSSG